MNRTEMLESIPPMLTWINDGWCTPERAKLLAETVYDNQLRHCLCIGVYAGKSVVPVAAALKARGSGIIRAVDPWCVSASVAGMDQANRDWWGKLDHDGIYRKFTSAIDQFRLWSHVEVFRQTNREYADEYASGMPSLDYLEIDGNHGEDDCNFDVERFVPMIRKGGWLWYDDRFWAKSGYEKLARYGMVERVVMDTGVLCQKE